LGGGSASSWRLDKNNNTNDNSNDNNDTPPEVEGAAVPNLLPVSRSDTGLADELD